MVTNIVQGEASFHKYQFSQKTGALRRSHPSQVKRESGQVEELITERRIIVAADTLKINLPFTKDDFVFEFPDDATYYDFMKEKRFGRTSGNDPQKSNSYFIQVLIASAIALLVSLIVIWRKSSKT